MSKAAGGTPEGHRDVLELLARARPASLDRDLAGLPPEQAPARLATAAGATGAGAGGGAGAAARKTSGRRQPRRGGLLAGAGLTVTAAAAATAVLVATAGNGAPQAALLTAATVRQVAAASRSALATSGRAVVAYRTTSQRGAFQDSGTDDITFSGKNWNDAISQTFPNAKGQPGHTQFAINRIVNGQFYLYVAGRTPRLQWYHDTNPSGHPSFTIPDPRTVLRALSPSARFEAAGYQVIDGMRLRELRATDLGHLIGLGALSGFAPVSHVRSLEVWVDARGVVHRLSLTSVAASTVYPLRADNLRHEANGTLVVTVPNKAMAAHLRAKLHRARLYTANGARRIIVRVAPPGSWTAHREVQVTALTVTFSGIGQPQRITAPEHAIQQFGRG